MDQLSPQELKQWMESSRDFALIDVREAWEREAFNIGGMHIPMGDLMAHQADIPANKDVVLYCEKGIRSVIAIQRMEAAGHARLYNLAGGMKAWKSQA